MKVVIKMSSKQQKHTMKSKGDILDMGWGIKRILKSSITDVSKQQRRNKDEMKR